MLRRAALGILLTGVVVSLWGLTHLVYRFEFSDLAQGEGSASKAYRIHEQEFGSELVAEFRVDGPRLPPLSDLRDWVQAERLRNPGVRSLLGPWQMGHFVSKGTRVDFEFSDSTLFFTRDLAQFFGASQGEQLRFYVGFWNDLDRPFRAQNLEAFEDSLKLRLQSWAGVRVQVVGPAAFAKESQEYMFKDQHLNLLAAFLVLAVAFLLWRSVRLGILLLGSLVLSSGVVLGLMGWFGAPLDSVSSILLIVIAFASIEDFVFLVHSGRVTGRIDREAFQRIWLPCLLTSVTTAEGFLALLTSDLSMIGRFGLWVAVGAFVEWIVVFYVLPPFLDRYPQWGVVPKRSLPGGSKFQIPRKLAWGLLLAPFVSLWFAPPLKTHVDPFELFSKDNPLRQAAASDQETRQMIGLYESSQDLGGTMDSLRKQPGVKSVVTANSVLDFWISKMESTNSELLRWVQRQWEQAGLSERFESASGMNRVYVQLESKHSDEFQAWARAQKHVQFTNDYWVYGEFAELVIKTLQDSTWLALILVGSLILGMALWLGQWRSIPKLIVCAFWGPVSMLAICSWMQIPVTVNLAPFAAVLMGLSGDNAIQFLYFSRSKLGLEGASQAWGRASIEVSIFMLALASLPLLSAFSPAGTLALFLMGGVVMALLGELYLFSSLGSVRSA